MKRFAFLLTLMVALVVGCDSDDGSNDWNGGIGSSDNESSDNGSSTPGENNDDTPGDDNVGDNDGVIGDSSVITNGLTITWSSDASAEQKTILSKLVNNMVSVQGGTFQMGSDDNDASESERPVHSVALTNDYYIGKFEVTQEEWVAVMGSNPSYFSGTNLPVEQVSWYDIVDDFLPELNRLTGLSFRLPTEAEWEYAARGGNKSRGYKYSGSNNIDDVAWHEDNGERRTTHSVGTKQANELGLYDMSGNVLELCSDLYGAYSATSQTNPLGASSGSNRVMRGGSHYAFEGLCRVSFRSGCGPSHSHSEIGFRLALSSSSNDSFGEGGSGGNGSNEESINGLTVTWVSSITASQQDILRALINNMVSVEGGTFQMGSDDSDADDDEQPIHNVTLSSYRINKYELTQEEWETVLGSYSNVSCYRGAHLPVESVSWEEINEFIIALNHMTGLSFRLPTEAEWEYAARGGNRSQGYKYSGSNTIEDVAWWYNNCGDKTHSVGTKQANELGLYDMSGNVGEWCSDWYGDYSSSSQANPMGPFSGEERVLRGGDYVHSNEWDCRVSSRESQDPNLGESTYGFRLAL